jgi:hypothetical protein
MDGKDHARCRSDSQDRISMALISSHGRLPLCNDRIALLLRCMSPLMARSDRSRFGFLTVAFEAKRTYAVVRLRPSQSQMTRFGH